MDLATVAAGLRATWSRRLANRGAILEPCLGSFERVERRVEPDGYPSVTGVVRGRSVAIRLVADSLAPKRLPQLWLSIVVRRAVTTAPLVLTARPRGEDYVSMRSRVAGTLDVPAWLPEDFSVRGDALTLAALAADRSRLAASFFDPAFKEIAFMERQTHMLHRLSEGRRGRHLIFRESVFRDPLTRDRFDDLFGTIERLDRAVTGWRA